MAAAWALAQEWLAAAASGTAAIAAARSKALWLQAWQAVPVVAAVAAAVGRRVGRRSAGSAVGR
eukprot:5812971-Alexandrium_andersonii.AAC.1